MYKCVLCSSDRNVSNHHIDYKLDNSDENNLIPICDECYQTIILKDMTFWNVVFNILRSGSKIVTKGWGFEVHITNTYEYCLKYLILYKGRKFSYHYHPIKKELWHCLLGKLEARIGEQDSILLQSGDKIEILPYTKHQLSALNNTIITEVSTRDFPEDSIRITKGD